MEPDLMPLMRQQHNELGLNADLALAWHESGHAVTASAFGRLYRVQIDPCPRAYFDRAGINQNEDVCIAIMGPAAQLAYVALHQKKEPSSCFYDQWVYDADRNGLKGLSQHWPTVELEEDEWRSRFQRLSRSIQQNRQVSDVLKLCAETLVGEGTLSSEAVENLIRDGKGAILYMLSKQTPPIWRRMGQ